MLAELSRDLWTATLVPNGIYTWERQGGEGREGEGKIDVRLRRRQTLHGETRASDRCIRSKRRVHRGCELISLDDTAEQKAREGVDNGSVGTTTRYTC